MRFHTNRSTVIFALRSIARRILIVAVLSLMVILAAVPASADTLKTFTVGTSGWVQFGMCSPCPADPFPIDATSTITIDTSTGKLVASHVTASGTPFGSTGPFSFQSQQSGSGYTLLTFSGSAVYDPAGNGNFTIQLNIYVPVGSLVSYSGGALCSITNPCTAGPTVEVIQCVGSNCTGSGAYTGTYTANAGQLTATTVTNLPNTVPLIYPLVPSARAPGGPAFTLTVIGTGFVSGAVVNWNGSARTTTFVSSSQVTAAITAGDIATAGTATITVTNPTPGGGTSNAQHFEVVNPVTPPNFNVFNPLEIVGFASNRSNLVVGDFNNDGKLDWAGYLNGTIWVFLGNGDGTFQLPIPSAGPPPGPSGTYPYLAAADLNGDGKLDLVVMNANGTFVALGNGNGTLGLLGTSLSDVINGGALVIADFNGDGFLDLAYVTPGSLGVPTAIQVQLGNGDGTFRLGPHTPFSGASSQFLKYALATGDFRRMGKLDLVASVADTAGCIAQDYLLFVFPGNGDGSFANPSYVPGTRTCGNQGPLNAVVADFNGDGFLDIAYFNVQASTTVAPGPGFLSVSLGNGNGGFIGSPFQVVDPPGANFTMVGPLLVGDFNGDGKPDLLTGNRFLYGNGDGSFTAQGPPQGNGLQAVQVGDFNGDGNADLLALGSDPYSASLFDIQLLLQAPGAPDFYGGVKPQSQTAAPGGSATYTISHVAVNGFGGTVTSMASNLPPGVTATFNPATVTGSGTTTLTLAVANTVPLGTYRVTLNGTSGGLSHSTFVDLVVNSSVGDFVGSMAGTDSIENINSGQNATYTFQINPIGGYTGDVTLSVSGLPPGATGTFNPPVIHGASGTSTLTVVTPASTPTNVYTLTITGTSGPLTHSGTVFLGVRSSPGDWSGSITPSTLTVPVGGSGTYTISTVGLNGFNNDIKLSISGVPAGPQAVYSPGPIIFTGTGSAILTISAPPGTPTGTYQLTSTGSGGGRIRSGVVTLIIQ